MDVLTRSVWETDATGWDVCVDNIPLIFHCQYETGPTLWDVCPPSICWVGKTGITFNVGNFDLNCGMNNKPKHSRKNIRLENFDYKGSSYVYFITICAHDKQHYFSNVKVAKIIKDEIEFRMINEIKLFCYCIMPDHLHMLLSLTENYAKKGAGKSIGKGTLQNWVSAFKRYTSRIANQLFEIKPLWQKNFYDHIVRKEESFLKIAEYIVNNPVRKGMVSEWEEYPYRRIIDPLPD